MEEFAGVSGVWTTGGCEEESAGAVEVVNFFFSFFWRVICGICGMGDDDFSVFNEGRRVVGGGVFSSWGGREKRSCGYIPL